MDHQPNQPSVVKLRYDLIHPLMLQGLAQVFTVGMKHGANNWLLEPMPWSAQVAALQRHLVAFLSGQAKCPIDGQNHLDSVGWRALTLSVYQQLGLGRVDLPGWIPLQKGDTYLDMSEHISTDPPIPDWLTPGHGGRYVH